MRKTSLPLAILGGLLLACSLEAQQVCPGLPYVAGSPEDDLMQAISGAEKPEEQIAVLDKYVQEHAGSKFIPCAYEFYSLAYLKLNNYDKAVEYGEKGLSADYKDVMLMLNVLKGYVGSGKVDDSVFEIINQLPERITAESRPDRVAKVTDAELQKTLKENAALASDERAYTEYAFFQLLPRVTDASKRLDLLDKFVKAYPDDVEKNAKQIDYTYFIAYKVSNKPDKAVEYGEKTIAVDPDNLTVHNLLAYDYAVGRTNADKAVQYAKKAIDLAGQMKKPEGVSDAQFQQERNNQLGMAHLSLGYVNFTRSAKTKKLQPAIEELKSAADLLAANPELQGQALYYLGYAYESGYPANHRGAIDALTKAASLQSSWKGQAADLLAKVKRAANR